jgi:hypothetical protein
MGIKITGPDDMGGVVHQYRAASIIGNFDLQS